MKTVSPSRTLSFALVTIAALTAACSDGPPSAPEAQIETPAQLEALSGVQNANFHGLGFEKVRTLATLLLSTARYHNLEVAKAEGFVFLHGCENRPDEGPVGTVYVHMGRLTDGKIDPSKPDALIYEPQKNGRFKLIGIEMAVPYPLWTKAAPPTFLGESFQKEDEFGVWGLHVWLWSYNPEGLFAESNPRVSCAD